MRMQRVPLGAKRLRWLAAMVAGALAGLPGMGWASSSTAALAATPPMGWNSYDAYGTTITERQFRANVLWMSRHLRRYGWRYAVIDAERLDEASWRASEWGHPPALPVPGGLRVELPKVTPAADYAAALRIELAS